MYDLAAAIHLGTARGALVINDRVDVALALGASKVHLGQRSFGEVVARALLGPDAVIGVSVHDRAEARDEHAAGADYWMVGHVFTTPSHAGVPGRGVEWIGGLAGAPGSPPVVAVGGISPDRVGVLLEAGVHGCAVLRGVWEAPDPVEAVWRYLSVLQDL